MAVYYPKIAVFTYKDKGLSIKVPIRVKLIELTDYECKLCNTSGSVNDIVDWYSRHSKPKDTEKAGYGFEYGFDRVYRKEYGGVGIQEELLDKQGYLLCPTCKLGDVNKNKEPTDTRVEKKPVFKLKVYTTYQHFYVDTSKLLQRNIVLQWRDRHTRYGADIASYPKDIETMYKELELVRLPPKMEKMAKRKLDIVNKDVTMEQLRKLNDEYKLRRFAREI